MKNSWIAMEIKVPSVAADILSSELAELGCEGVTIEERALDTFVAPDPDVDLPDFFTVKAYFPAPDDLMALRQKVRECLDDLSAIFPQIDPVLPEVAVVRNEDWAEGWKQHFPPLHVGGRLLVRPTWDETEPEPGETLVEIDPGMAFGTGTHATTRLCLEALVALWKETPPTRVLDVGTGSGILAIAAALLGAKRVLACDIDEEACRTARENAELNGVTENVAITGDPLESLEEGFDVILANILAEENVRLGAEFVRRLSPGGTLILSGILCEKEPLVLDAFERFSLSAPDVTRQDEWSCIVYRNEK